MKGLNLHQKHLFPSCYGIPAQLKLVCQLVIAELMLLLIFQYLYNIGFVIRPMLLIAYKRLLIGSTEYFIIQFQNIQYRQSFLFQKRLAFRLFIGKFLVQNITIDDFIIRFAVFHMSGLYI